MPEYELNPKALEPLFLPWEEPTRHRTQPKIGSNEPILQNGRRPSDIVIAANLRQELDDWRKYEYVGASETTRQLFNYWFKRDHQFANGDPFHYYFCQREAIETFVYCHEHRRTRRLSELIDSFGGENRETSALGIHESEERWPRYAFRIATGAGKTKIMSMAMVWSYYHSLYESDSDCARNFLVIAPNLTVFERLKQDFADGRIFDTDPLIPPEWKGDWNLTTVLQDEASTFTKGTLYLTNIHRLYEKRKTGRGGAEFHEMLGPAVSKAKALDTGEALRKRITSHQNLMVLNDEAHHVWDPDSAWTEALDFLNNTFSEKNGQGLMAQLDFSATPKDNHGNLFKQIIVDSPLGEAVDAGIVKVPVIGKTEDLRERASDDAAERYEEHLAIGYGRWLKSLEEWQDSGKKPLMFVMCEDTKDADSIARRLNTDPRYQELNGKTINLHTNLKGEVKKVKGGGRDDLEFVINEKSISDEDLKALRKLSRELDDNSSPYRCIVSVLMLREGWDVRNVTTIVPLRPYTSKANILPEQTLGRGLRRMTPPGQATEMVVVVEHPAFVSLYNQELATQGVLVPTADVDKIPRTTVSIFPDNKKDLQALDILIPALTDSFEINPHLKDLTYESVMNQAKGHPKLSVLEPRKEEVEFEGRALITGEVVERMKVYLPLLENGVSAITYFREEIEATCKIKNTHPVLAPLLQQFITQDLFEFPMGINDKRLVSRLQDSDVSNRIRSVFVPLVRANTLMKQKPRPYGAPISMASWKPFQVTNSENKPAIASSKTLFNLVPCDRGFEAEFTRFMGVATDVRAFAKNAGPQALRIDYQGRENYRGYYTPDFFVRTDNGNLYLVETKGREDSDVPVKVKAAMAWCKYASQSGTHWEYVYVPQGLYKRLNNPRMEMLKELCKDELLRLVADADNAQQGSLPFYETTEQEQQTIRDQFIRREEFENLPAQLKRAVEESVNLYGFLEGKNNNFAPCFIPLLPAMDNVSKNMVIAYLGKCIPDTKGKIESYFLPDISRLNKDDKKWLERNGETLKKALVYQSFMGPIALLSFCLQYAKKEPAWDIGGVFADIQKVFGKLNNSATYDRVEAIRNFRNKYVAHQEVEEAITDSEVAKGEIKNWVSAIVKLHKETMNQN